MGKKTAEKLRFDLFLTHVKYRIKKFLYKIPASPIVVPTIQSKMITFVLFQIKTQFFAVFFPFDHT